MSSISSNTFRLKQPASLVQVESDACSSAEHPDPQEDSNRNLSSNDAYRRLYGILLLMTVALFAINLLQVCLLHKMSNLYWIVLFPGLVFVSFTTWVGLEIVRHFSAFRTKDASVSEGLVNTSVHLVRLVKRRETVARRPEIGGEKQWPTHFNRASVILTILLNIILVEFVYLPVFAVPGFKEKEWAVSLETTSPQMTPAVAVIQPLNVTVPQWAWLPQENASWSDLCQYVSTYLAPTEHCFAGGVSSFYNQSSAGALGDNFAIRYAIFNPAVLPELNLYQPVDLWYPYSYDGTIGTIITTFAFFDPKLIPIFPIAYQCGLLASVQVGAQSWYQMRLRQFSVSDSINAMNREGICQNEALREYVGYEPSITYLGPVTTQGNNDCDYTSPGYSGTCNGVTQVEFGSILTTTYRSKHGKALIEILTDEGGIVGFVTFLTWFFGIFKM